MLSRRILIPLVMGNVVGCLLFVGVWRLSASATTAPSDEVVVVDVPKVSADFALPALANPPPPGPILRKVVHTVRAGQAFGRIVQDAGGTGVNAMLEAARPHADLAKIRPGEQLEMLLVDDTAVELTYALDEDRTLILGREDGEWQARVDEVIYDVHVGRRDVQVDVTLWDAAIDAGFRALDVVRLAKVFEYDVDFATELRAGARLSVVMDELSQEGAYVKPGALHAVRLENAGKVTTAIFFPREDEEGAWYSAEGRTRARPFLRSPLAFARITSGFNPKRIDPITGQRLGHGAVDFGAPTGTPIRAAGDGVVAWAKWNGGHGLHVKLDHPQVGPYRTAYSHLSKLMVKKGQKVRQGDIIGLVGSTGHSTGPHLHYEFWVNGKRVDPMKHVSPVGRTLAEHEMAAFEQVRDQWLPLLEDPVVAEWNHEGTPRVEPL